MWPRRLRKGTTIATTSRLARLRSKVRRTPSRPSTPEPKFVLARRADGLGVRINNVLNAMKLAGVLGVEFRFTWPHNLTTDEDHAIVPAEQFFSADFLGHLIDHRATKSGFTTPVGPKADLPSLREQLERSERGLLAQGRTMDEVIDPDAVPEYQRGLAEEFEQVGFHPDIEAMIAAARVVPIGNDAVGIHLRAGDNLYGIFRSWTRYSRKAISASVARALIERFRAEGRAVVVFGQDDELIDELCESTGSMDARTLRPAALTATDGTPSSSGQSRAAEAMFDVVLMSRCARIIGGSSGFALQAAWISDKGVERHLDLLRPAEVLALTRADIATHGDRYSPTQKAFAWWTAYYEVRHDIPYDDAAELLTAGLEADPSNPRARIRLAALNYHHGHIDRGDEVLVDALAFDVATGDETLASVLLVSQTAGGGKFDSTGPGTAASRGS